MANNRSKILVIDDLQDNLIILNALIKDAFPEAITLNALNGKTGLELAAKEDPDVILLDIIMPGMDGYEVCQKLKADKKLCDIPVVFVTAAENDKKALVQAVESGGEAFLTKPIDEIELTAQIRAMLKIREANNAKKDEKVRLEKLVEERSKALVQELKTRKKTEQNLIQNQYYLKKAQEIGSIGTWEFDLVKNELFWTEQNYINFGVPLNTPLTYEIFLECIHPDDRDYVNEEWMAAIDGKPYDIEHRLIGDGKVRWVREKADVEFDDNNKAIRAIGFTQDITDRKQAEIVLNDLIEKNPISIQIVDTNGFTLRTNPAHTSLFGLVPPPDFSTFDDLQSKSKDLEKLILLAKSGEIVHFPDIYYNIHDINPSFPDTPVWIKAIIFPLKDSKNKPERFVFMHEDITERKQSEEKIREKDIQFRKLSANVPDLIFQFTRRPDGTYCVPIATEGIRNIFGCSPEDVVNDFTPIGKVIYPEDAERVFNDIEYSAKHLTYFTCEFRVHIPGKEIQWIYSRSSPEKLADGSITWYGFNADITKRKEAELELVKAKEKAEESDRLKSAFLANMSHEIRTPMNGILGFAQLLKEPDLTGEEQQHFISIMEKSGERMLNIITAIVNISKIESGSMEVSMSDTNVNQQIDFVYDFFKPAVEGNGMQFIAKTALPSKEAIINSDREKIYAILTNLVGNAIKFTKKGSIEFGYAKKGNYLEFFVKDTGDGIDDKKKEIIFERFRQGSESLTRGYEGAGLGLSISKAYVEMLGGQIWVESELGKGSTFYFTIPCNAETEAKIVTEKLVSVDKEEIQNKKLKILLVEDDEASEQFLSLVVRPFGIDGFKARTGIEAIEVCRNNPGIDLILMDIRMPEMDGYEAIREIRKFNKDVVIIAQTAYGLSGDREKAIEAGCNDYISKPIVKDILMAVIQKHLISPNIQISPY